MLLEKASKVEISNSGVIFIGEYGEIIGKTPIEKLQGMVAGYTTYGDCGNNCPFCKGRPDISIPGFLRYDEANKKPIFKLIVDRRRNIVKKLVGTVIKPRVTPSHILYITAIPLDNPLNYNNARINRTIFEKYVEIEGVGYLFQIIINDDLG